MTDKSKLPIHRVEELDNELNNVNTNISTLNSDIVTINNILPNKFDCINLEATDFNTIKKDGIYNMLLDNVINYNQPIISTSTYHTRWMLIVTCNGNIQTAYCIGIQGGYPNTYRRRIIASGEFESWYQIEGRGLDMPSKKTINVALQANGAEYIAPANGYYCLKAWFTNSSINGSFIGLYNQTSPIYTMSVPFSTSANYRDTAIYLPVNRGDIITCHYANVKNDSTLIFKFIYANSEVPMNER